MPAPSPIAVGGAGGAEVLLRLKVVPGGSRDEVVGLHGDRLRVKVAAPPEGGRANRAVADLIADRLGVPRRAVRLVAGASSPQKTLAVSGVTVEAARSRLLP